MVIHTRPFLLGGDNWCMSPLPAEEHPQPNSLTDLFISFTVLALQGFGGVLTVVQRELVEKKRWLTQEEFIEDWAVAQVLPGPNVINLAVMIGGRSFGIRGALVSLAGLLTAPLFVVLTLSLLYAQFASNPAVAGALRAMAAVTAGLITAMGLKLLMSLPRNILGLKICGAFCLLCFVMIALLRWPLTYVLPSLGLLASSLAYRQLKKRAT